MGVSTGVTFAIDDDSSKKDGSGNEFETDEDEDEWSVEKAGQRTEMGSVAVTDAENVDDVKASDGEEEKKASEAARQTKESQRQKEMVRSQKKKKKTLFFLLLVLRVSGPDVCIPSFLG